MPAPYRHKITGIYGLRVRVPRDLIAVVGKTVVKKSLGTRDPVEARAAFHLEMGKLQASWQSLRKGTTSVSQKEAVAIAGEFYRELVSAHEENPGDRMAVLRSLLWDQVAAGSPQVKIIPAGNPVVTDKMLARLKSQNRKPVQDYLEARGEIVDPESFDRIMAAVNAAIVQGREQILRFADGDYRKDPQADRFPPRTAKPKKEADAVGSPDRFRLTAIYEKYADETEQALSTRKKWRAIIAGVAEVHPDIRTIDPYWCVDWKDGLKAKGLSARSIQFGYIAALRSTCKWAVENRLLASNPVEGIGVKVKKTPQGLKMRGYDDDEATAILKLALEPVEGRYSPFTAAAKRWIPWICCYTGARVGEIAQLRKSDIQFEKDIPVIWIRPEAGAVKDGNPRRVAIHSHLIETGLMQFVAKSAEGPLFFDVSRARGGKDENPQFKKVGQRICKWIRDAGYTDLRIAPNHAWRHRFKTESRVVKMDPGTRDYIQGHVPSNEAEGYGVFKPEVLRYEIEKLARIAV